MKNPRRRPAGATRGNVETASELRASGREGGLEADEVVDVEGVIVVAVGAGAGGGEGGLEADEVVDVEGVVTVAVGVADDAGGAQDLEVQVLGDERGGAPLAGVGDRAPGD